MARFLFKQSCLVILLLPFVQWLPVPLVPDLTRSTWAPSSPMVVFSLLFMIRYALTSLVDVVLIFYPKIHQVVLLMDHCSLFTLSYWWAGQREWRVTLFRVYNLRKQLFRHTFRRAISHRHRWPLPNPLVWCGVTVIWTGCSYFKSQTKHILNTFASGMCDQLVAFTRFLRKKVRHNFIHMHQLSVLVRNAYSGISFWILLTWKAPSSSPGWTYETLSIDGKVNSTSVVSNKSQITASFLPATMVLESSSTSLDSFILYILLLLLMEPQCSLFSRSRLTDGCQPGKRTGNGMIPASDHRVEKPRDWSPSKRQMWDLI